MMKPMMAKYILAEVKGNPWKLVKSFVFLTLASAFVAANIFSTCIPYVNETVFLNNSDYEWIGYSSNQLPSAGFQAVKTVFVYDIFYENGGLAFSDHIYLDLFVMEDKGGAPRSYFNEKNFQIGSLQDVQLQENGIAVSSNVAHRYGIEVGDSCFLLGVTTHKEDGTSYIPVLPVTVAAILRTKSGGGGGIVPLSGVGLVLPSTEVSEFIKCQKEPPFYVTFGAGNTNPGEFEKIIQRKDQLAATSITKNSLPSSDNLAGYIIAFLAAVGLFFLVKRELGHNIGKRARNIGILRAMGMSKQSIANGFAFEQAAVLALTSVAAGNVCRFVLMKLVGYVDFRMLVVIITVTLAIGLLSLVFSLFPVKAALNKMPVTKIISSKEV